MTTKLLSWPRVGCGVGLRPEHYDFVTREWPKMDWFEAISENFMDSGGRPLRILEEVRRHYPVALHGTSLSIGSVDPLNQNYLERLKRLVDRIDPFIVSDHLCWSGVDGDQLHDLLPLPFTEEALQHVVERVQKLQDFLGRRILLENISTYITYRHSTMPEWEFLLEAARRADCGILFDINNLYVNSVNHQFDPYESMEHIPGERVGQFHLAGHTDMGAYLFDTHSRPVIEEVWKLYRRALKLWGPVSTLIERDEDIPDFPRLAEEAARARAISLEVCTAGLPGQIDVSGGRPPRPRAKEIEGPSLADLQRWMKSRIQPRVDASFAEKLSSVLNPQGGAPGIERILVYSRGYTARIEEALKEVYEAVRHVLGAGNFHRLAEEYAPAFPSHYYNLNLAGGQLAEFLVSWPKTKELPFLPDLARLEWRVAQAFHAFDETPLNPDSLTHLSLEDWENTKLIFQPSVALVSSPWPLLDIWNARTQPVEKVDIDMVNHPQKVLVRRKGERVRCELLDENQYQLLEGLLAGLSLGAVCEKLAETMNNETLPLAEWFSRWIQDGLIRRSDFSAPVSAKSPA